MPRRVDQLWVYIVTDANGDEGVLRRATPDGPQPLMGDVYEKVTAPDMMAEAIRAAGQLKMPLKLAHFARRGSMKIPPV